ncbi:MAG TPA: sugar phosphate isomerase/epimerase family protein [Anaerolineae bacterium]
MIKYGINTFIWASPFRTKDLYVLDKAKAMGYDLVEIPVEGEDDLDYAVAAEAFRRTGLDVSICAVMGPNRDPSHEDPAIQAGGVAYLKHCIDAVVQMGGKTIGGPIYAAVGRQWQATPEQRRGDLERTAANLREVAAYAESKGVTLAMEPLNRFETSFINIMEQACELMEMIDSPAIKLMIDTFHANIEEKNIGKAIELAGPNLVHVHANENDRGAPGSGHVAWPEVAAALKKVNYSGAMVIETFTTEVKEIARAAAIWRPLAATQDGLAEDGLAYLKQLMA